MTKIKAAALAFIITIIVLATADQALSGEPEECQKFFNDYIGPVVNARDSGINPVIIVQQLTMIGLAQKAALGIVGMVYQVHQDKDKAFIEKDYMDWCSGEST